MRTILLLAWLIAGAAAAQGYPDRVVRVLVGYPPGGGTDLVARLVAQPLSERWKQPVVVENRPGANAIIATEAVVKAKPDGYTLLMGYATELALNPATHKALPYDPVRDLAPIAQLASAPLVLAVHPTLAAQNVRELIALAKAKPGALSYSSSGSGSVHHFAGELFKLRSGADIVHVPYKGSGPATADAVSGQVQVTFASVASVLRFVQAGRLRALAVTSRERSPQLADVPTAIESGVPDVELTSWYGLLAPAGTPADVIKRVAADVAAVLALPEVKKGFAAQGLDMAQSSPEAFAAFIREEAAKYARIARASNIQQE
ncbi:MAG TPA: tripartite tricarboxylate transporter substrate binding protein [Burkholderiales bacterium]|nr:tripartite tricarboxylate transporter substrate binding protein [Burkholderiales bacterium]